MTESPIIRPVLSPATTPEPKNHIPSPNRVTKQKWAFSFRFWRQIENFGLDKVDQKWLVSVFERFKDLSEKDLSDFLADGQEKGAWRYHRINWDQKNIPIQREELGWLSPDYLDNDTEYPIVQFQISKSLGRVIGFFDENNIFQVIFLDPFHNMQPSKSHGYRVDPCSPLRCDYSILLDKIQNITSNCAKDDCKQASDLAKIENRRHDLMAFHVLMLTLDESNMQYACELMESGKAKSLTEIFEIGLINLDS